MNIIQKVEFPMNSKYQQLNSHEQKITVDAMKFLINEEDNTAKIIKIPKNFLFLKIPSAISVFDTEFEIKSISDSLFHFNDCFRIEFAPNSQIKSFKKDAFIGSTIKILTIPSSVVELEDGWCNYTPKLDVIIVERNNPNFISYDNGNYILGKSSPEKENYDVLIFAIRCIEIAIIPSFIEIIGKYAFQYCSKLQRIEIPNDSKLRIIDDCSFEKCPIESIDIPSCLTKIGKCAFYECEKLQQINIPKNSELKEIGSGAFNHSKIKTMLVPSDISDISGITFQMEKLEFISNKSLYIHDESDNYILTKSSPEKEVYDVLYWAKKILKLQIFHLLLK